MAEQISTPSTSILPNFHLLCIDPSAVTAFNNAVTKLFPSLPSYITIKIHECSLKFLDPDLKFDAVVSPANSYGRLDGAFDDALARAYKPEGGSYDWITTKAQKVLYSKYKGYAPPGTCTVVPLNHPSPPWGTEYLLLCPTMRTPSSVRWDREVVYECIWSMLCAIDGQNKTRTEGEKEIKSILMTPLATGCGDVSYQRWAEQTVIAMKHFVEAVEKPEVWGCMGWQDVWDREGELNETWEGDEAVKA